MCTIGLWYLDMIADKMPRVKKTVDEMAPMDKVFPKEKDIYEHLVEIHFSSN